MDTNSQKFSKARRRALQAVGGIGTLAAISPNVLQAATPAIYSTKWTAPADMVAQFARIPNWSNAEKDTTRTLTHRSKVYWVDESSKTSSNLGTFENPWTSLKAHLSGTGGYLFDSATFNDCAVLIKAGTSIAPSGYTGGTSGGVGEYQIAGDVVGLTIGVYRPRTGAQLITQDPDPLGTAVQGKFLPAADRVSLYATLNTDWTLIANQPGPAGINILAGAKDIVIRGIAFKGYGYTAVRINGNVQVRIEDCVIGNCNNLASNGANSGCITTAAAGTNVSIARLWLDTNVVDLFQMYTARNGSDPMAINNVAGRNTCASNDNGNFHSDIVQAQPQGMGIHIRYLCIEHKNSHTTDAGLGAGSVGYQGKAFIYSGNDGTGANSSTRYCLIVTDVDGAYCDTGAQHDIGQVAYVFLPRNGAPPGPNIDTIGPDFFNLGQGSGGSLTDIVYASATGGDRCAQNPSYVPVRSNCDYSQMSITA